jgi:hypothetical protein
MKPVTKRAISLECVLVLAAVAFLLLQKGQEGRSAERVRFIREALSALPEEVGPWKAGDPEDIKARQPHDVADSIRILVRIYRNSLTGARAFLQASHWYAPAYCYELHGWAVLKDTVLHGNELPGYPELSGRVRELVVARKDEASTVLLYEIAVRRIPAVENAGTMSKVPSRRPATVGKGTLSSKSPPHGKLPPRRTVLRSCRWRARSSGPRENCCMPAERFRALEMTVRESWIGIVLFGYI